VFINGFRKEYNSSWEDESDIRNLAISLVRRIEYSFIADAWADISIQPDLSFSPG
jgi:hypothetical protein